MITHMSTQVILWIQTTEWQTLELTNLLRKLSSRISWEIQDTTLPLGRVGELNVKFSGEWDAVSEVVAWFQARREGTGNCNA